MLKKYSDLLPSYLNGPNIRKHAEILEVQDKKIEDKIELLQLWNKLDRPILIERVQEEPAVCTVNVHLHSPTPIRSVHFDHYGTDTEYAEEDLVTDTVLTFTTTDVIPPVMPDFEVTMTTWDDRTFRKGYPENDTNGGNAKDHDEFLEIIGNLLGIPRRIYIEPEQMSERIMEEIYPHYFTKSMYSGHPPGGILTEDDYYYASRLKHFIENRYNKPLPLLMAEILYEWRDLTYTTMMGRNTSIPKQYAPLKDSPCMNIELAESRYLNIDYTNMESILNQYASITRPLAFSEPSLSYFHFDNATNSYVNRSIEISGQSYYQTEREGEDKSLSYVPVSTKINGKQYTSFVSDENGEYSMQLQGLSYGTNQIHTVTETEYEFEGIDDYSYVSVDSAISVNLQDWSYARRQNGSTSLYRQPFMNENNELSVGRIAICRTPLIDPRIVDLSSYYVRIDFRFVNTNSYLGLSTITENDDGTYKEHESFIRASNYVTPDFDSSYSFEVDFIDNVAYFYFDGDYTSVSYDFTDTTDMLYLYGYANHSITDNQTLSFIEGYVDNNHQYPEP